MQVHKRTEKEKQVVDADRTVINDRELLMKISAATTLWPVEQHVIKPISFPANAPCHPCRWHEHYWPCTALTPCGNNKHTRPIQSLPYLQNISLNVVQYDCWFGFFILFFTGDFGCKALLRGHKGTIWSLWVGPDHIVSGSADMSVRIWANNKARPARKGKGANANGGKGKHQGHAEEGIAKRSAQAEQAAIVAAAKANEAVVSVHNWCNGTICISRRDNSEAMHTRGIICTRCTRIFNTQMDRDTYACELPRMVFSFVFFLLPKVSPV